MKIYEADIEPDEMGYSATFPDIPGCTTQGDDLQDVCEMASDALSMMLVTMIEDGRPIPEPTYGRDSDGSKRIIAFAVDLESDDGTLDLVTVNQAADMLGVTSQRIQALIKSGNLTSRKIGTSRMIEQRSVLDYRARRPGAGRPKKALAMA